MANKRNMNNYNNDVNIKEGLILVSVLTVIVLLMYFLTVGAQKIGLFDEGYIKPEVSPAVISYENSLVGSIFNKIDEEYYVMLADFSENNNIVLSSLGAKYKNKDEHLPIYSVDLSNPFNKGIVGSTSNPSAQSVSELSINEPTLIFFKDGKNYRYIVGIDNIKEELDV